MVAPTQKINCAAKTVIYVLFLNEWLGIGVYLKQIRIGGFCYVCVYGVFREGEYGA